MSQITTKSLSLSVFNFSTLWDKSMSMSLAISKGRRDEADMVRQESCLAGSNQSSIRLHKYP